MVKASLSGQELYSSLCMDLSYLRQIKFVYLFHIVYTFHFVCFLFSQDKLRLCCHTLCFLAFCTLHCLSIFTLLFFSTFRDFLVCTYLLQTDFSLCKSCLNLFLELKLLLSNEGKVSRSRKQWKPLIGLYLTIDRLFQSSTHFALFFTLRVVILFILHSTFNDSHCCFCCTFFFCYLHFVFLVLFVLLKLLFSRQHFFKL